MKRKGLLIGIGIFCGVLLSCKTEEAHTISHDKQSNANQDKLDSLRAENQQLKAFLETYNGSYDSLNAIWEINIAHDHPDSIKKCYFNLEDFTTPKIYVFEDEKNSSVFQYWKISSVPEKNLLITEAFNREKEQLEYFSEKITEEGAHLEEFIMFEGENQIRTKPVQRSVYLWKHDSSYQYEVNYSTNHGSFEFLKTRALHSCDSLEILGEKRFVMKFEGDYQIVHQQKQDTLRFWQYSYYTKEFGFVKYQRHFKNSVLNMKLKAILTEKEWEAIIP